MAQCWYILGTSLVVGDVLASPGEIFRSQIGDIYEFTNDTVVNPAATPTDSDPVSYVIASGQNNQVAWIEANNDSFLVGTADREYSIDSFVRSSISIRPQTNIGSEYIKPVLVSYVPLYVQLGGRRIREMLYQERLNGYVAEDTTYMAEHITRESQNRLTSPLRPKIKGMTYQKTPTDLVWVWDNNGYLYSCTRVVEKEVVAWHRHEIGGSFGSDSFAFVISCAAVPNPNGGGWLLFALVKRTVNGATKVYLEKLQEEFDWSTLHPDSNIKSREPVFLDSAKVFRTHAAATFRATYKGGSSTAEVAGGTATATPTGTVTLSEVLASFPFAANAYLDYDAAGNADNQQAGCIRMRFFPNVEPGTSTLIAISKADSDADNLITITHASGTFVVTIKDSAGTNIVSETYTDAIVPNYTAPVTIELDWDITNGATRFFVNGKQVGSTATGTGTRDATIALLRVGGGYDGNNNLAGGIQDLQIFSTVQNTADHEVYEYQDDTTTVTGLDHLEGETVKALGNGKVLGEFTVASGAITLADPYDTVIVGLPYSHLVRPQPIEAGSGVGSAQGRPKRVDTLALRFYNSAQCKFGRSEANQEEIPFREASDDMSDPITLYTGDKVIPFEGAYDNDSSIFITGSDPLPCHITALVARGVTYD